MKLTEDNKKIIDKKTYGALKYGWRKFPIGSPWFQGETGRYWSKCLDKAHEEFGEMYSSNMYSPKRYKEIPY